MVSVLAMFAMVPQRPGKVIDAGYAGIWAFRESAAFTLDYYGRLSGLLPNGRMLRTTPLTFTNSGYYSASTGVSNRLARPWAIASQARPTTISTDPEDAQTSSPAISVTYGRPINGVITSLNLQIVGTLGSSDSFTGELNYVGQLGMVDLSGTYTSGNYALTLQRDGQGNAFGTFSTDQAHSWNVRSSIKGLAGFIRLVNPETKRTDLTMPLDWRPSKEDLQQIKGGNIVQPSAVAIRYNDADLTLLRGGS